MTTPGIAAQRFLISCLLGTGLGLIYGALRPLRRRFPWLGDGLFLAAAVWAWLELSFRVCRGDLRFGNFFGLAAGGLVWELTAGRLLRPVFAKIWKALGKFGYILSLPVKKFAILQKFCLHLRKNGLQ